MAPTLTTAAARAQGNNVHPAQSGRQSRVTGPAALSITRPVEARRCLQIQIPHCRRIPNGPKLGSKSMQSKLTRRAVLAGAPAVAAVAVMPAIPALAAQDPLREGVQALVNEIRLNLSRDIIMAQWCSLQEVADRLEALPGVERVDTYLWGDVGQRLEDFSCRRSLSGGAL